MGYPIGSTMILLEAYLISGSLPGVVAFSLENKELGIRPMVGSSIENTAQSVR